MLTGFKIRIHPTDEQIKKFYQYAGTSRFMYNWALQAIKEAYDARIKFKDLKLANQLTIIQKEVEGLQWLNAIPRRVKCLAIEDAENALKNFFKKTAKYPRFKSKKNSKISFSIHSVDNLPKDGFITIPLCGKVKLNLKDRLTSEIQNSHLTTRLTVTFDGKYWYLSGAYEKDFEISETTNASIGIDLGLKDLAITNEGKKFKNINKTKVVKKLKKRLKRVQRKLSRKYEKNKDGNNFIATKNINKLLIDLRLIYRKLTNIRQNHIEQITIELVKSKPSRIVMEDLNVKGMMKNRCLANAIGEANWYYFIECMRWKCRKYGIEFVLADRFYASSKTCSKCHEKHPNLTLKDRVFDCPHCDLVIDRDVNAAINLANYEIVE
jgi:putative transposase